MRLLKALLNKLFCSKLCSSRGVSLVEALVGAGLLGGLALIALKQSDMMGDSAKSSRENFKLIELQSEISNFLSNLNYCEENFAAGTPVPSAIGQLSKNGGDVVYQSGLSYKDNAITIESMKLAASSIDDGLELEVFFKKASGQNLSKKFPLFAEPDASKTQVTGCFSFSESMRSTVREIVAKKLCADGQQGTLIDQDKTCVLKGFPSSPVIKDCDSGESIRSVAYNSTAERFEATCEKTFNPSACSAGWIKKINPNGTFECANLADYVDETPFNVSVGSECNLEVNASNKIELECVEGACSYPSGVASVNECSGSGVCSDAIMCASDGVTTYVLCPAGETCNCISGGSSC